MRIYVENIKKAQLNRKIPLLEAKTEQSDFNKKIFK